MTTRFACAVALLSVAAVACGDSSSSGGAGGGVAAGGEGPGAGTPGGGDPVGGGGGNELPGCEELPANPGTENDVEVGTVAAAARDESGDAIANVNFQLCGKDFCLFALTSGVGTAAFTNTQSSGTIDRPVLKPGDSLVFGKIGYPYDPTGTPPLQGIFPSMTDSGAQFALGATVSAAGVELTMPAEGGVAFDELIYDSAAKKTFRAGRLAEADVEAATGSPDFSMVYALGPFETVFCPGAAVTFENYANLPADTAVEFWGQVLGASEPLGGYGEWIKLGDGSVSGDGATVSTDAAGLETLLTIAIKAI